METRVQKIQELIIARAQIGGVSTTREEEALLHKDRPLGRRARWPTSRESGG